MRVSLMPLWIAVVAAGAGWTVRGLQKNDEAPPPLVSRTATPNEPVVPDPEKPAAIAPRLQPPRPSSRGRNLFAFAVRDEAVPTYVLAEAPRRVEPPPPVTPTLLPDDPRPRFTYRYIGRFGPDRKPIAAFSRDGEIVIAREGQKIDSDFVLRSIGYESVEVEGTATTERVALGKSAG